MIRGMIGGLSLAGFLACAGGCLVSKGSTVEESGVKIAEPTLAQIEQGKTTESWLVATVGEPTSRTDVDEHTHIMRYEHTVTKKSGGAVFLIYAGSEKQQQKSTAIFEITDGVVTKYWTEH